MTQSDIPQISGSPNGIFDGPTGLLIADAAGGGVYIKRSPPGSKTGWKKLLDEDEAVEGGGGNATYETGIGDPATQAAPTTSIWLDETLGANRLYVKRSDSTWFLVGGEA